MQSVLVLFIKLLKSRFDLEDWLFSLVFLNTEISDFFPEGIKFSLLVNANALGFIVFFLDLTQLSRHFSDLFLIMLHC